MLQLFIKLNKQKKKMNSFIQKAFDKNRQWEKKDLCEVIYFMRQIVAIIIGLIWGIPPFTGIIGIAV